MIVSDQSQLFHFFFFLITSPALEIGSKVKTLYIANCILGQCHFSSPHIKITISQGGGHLHVPKSDLLGLTAISPLWWRPNKTECSMLMLASDSSLLLRGGFYASLPLIQDGFDDCLAVQNMAEVTLPVFWTKTLRDSVSNFYELKHLLWKKPAAM